MFEFLAVLLAIIYVPSLFIVHRDGFNKGYTESKYDDSVMAKQIEDDFKGRKIKKVTRF